MGARPGSDLDDDLAENAEINVTPFIDVMLVLLIIFMVAAPLSTVDIPVELPVAVAGAPERQADPVFITIKEDLSISVGETSVALDNLHIQVGIITHVNREERLYLRADRSVPYGEVIRVMNALKRDGYYKIGLVGLDEAAVGSDAAGPPEQ
jgi:biopolymer transport protein ExbD